MNRRKTFLWVAAAGGYIGIGMILGYMFGDQANNTPLWIGGLLVMLGALLLGMYVSAREARPHTTSETTSTRDAVEDETRHD